MDKALAGHAGAWGLNLDKTKEDFFSLEKNQICASIPSGTLSCALSLRMAHSYKNSGLIY